MQDKDIYTYSGDIVQEINHDDGSGSEAWGSITRSDYQLNKWTLGACLRIYIYRVESLVPGQEGESFLGKLAIVK
ncbi:MAG: hypothetical protein MZV64_37675 [Ignavibacteriales bacterium]|nr:hypothetical protein [Ignavibacteriales bacterium]